MRDERVQRGRTQREEVKLLGIMPFELNDIEQGRKIEQPRDVRVGGRSFQPSSDSQKFDGEKTMALIYREVYVGCGERPDGRWDVIAIPPGGARDDVRIVQADLELLEAVHIAARLRERVREFPQAEAYSADELLALCTRVRDKTTRIS